MTAGQHRVVVWSTGGIGSIAIRAIHQRPNLDLVGVWVHSEEKVGKDAGELANGEPIGAGHHQRRRRADRPQARLRHLCGQRTRARRAGDPRLREVAQRGNQRGDDEHHATGQPACVRAGRVAGSTRRRRERRARCRSTRRASNPDSPPTTCLSCSSTQSSQIEKIHAYEIGLYDDYGVPDIMSDAMGFGRPLSTTSRGSPCRAPSPVSGRDSSGMVADALGVEVQEVRETFDRAVTNRTLGGRDGHRRGRNLRRTADAGHRRRRRKRGHRHRARHPAGSRCRTRLADAFPALSAIAW